MADLETTTELIASDDRLDDVLLAAAAEERLALDTEFHREKTYYPKLALVQIAVGPATYLIDPLAVDISRIASLFGDDHLVVMHACRQDLEVLDHACGSSPSRIVDTQIAAGFVGYSSPSLASLLDRELGVSAPKADRLTDWLRRPLSDRQMSYAASDVDHLIALYDRLEARLSEAGRTGWCDEATSELMAEPRERETPRRPGVGSRRSAIFAGRIWPPHNGWRHGGSAAPPGSTSRRAT